MRRSLPLILTSIAVLVAVGFLTWQLWLTFAPTASPTPTTPTRTPANRADATAHPKEQTTKPTPPRSTPRAATTNTPLDLGAQRLAAQRAAAHPNPTVLRSPDRPEPVKVTLAGVTKFKPPLHANAPGRPPVKEGERVMGSESLPADPVAYAKSLGEAGGEVAAWLEEWERSVRAGTAAPAARDLRRALRDSELSIVQLRDLGRGVRYVNGAGPFSTLFYSRAVAQAEAIAAKVPGGVTPDTFSEEEVHALRNLVREVWEKPVEDFRLSARTFDLLGHAESEGSFERYRARKLYGEALYEMGRNDPASLEKAIEIYQGIAADPGVKVTSELEAEHHWMLSCVYGQARRYEDGLPDRRAAAAASGQYFTVDARILLIQELAHLHMREEALQTWDRYRDSIPQDRHGEIAPYLVVPDQPTPSPEPL